MKITDAEMIKILSDNNPHLISKNKENPAPIEFIEKYGYNKELSVEENLGELDIYSLTNISEEVSDMLGITQLSVV